MMQTTSLLPKIVFAALLLAAFHHVTTYNYKISPIRVTSVSSLPNNHTDSPWFKDAIRKHQDGHTSLTHTASPTNTAPSETPTGLKRDYSSIHTSYGSTQCMPHFDTSWQQVTVQRNASCSQHAPFPVDETRRVGFASITTGPPSKAYQRAILTQMLHAAVHNSSFHILCDELSDGAFNKIAFLLQLVMQEMLKPASQRLEWLMWTDRDAIVLDACRPLCSFLPPNEPEFEKIQLIVNHDINGLNAGLFFLKISHWMINYLNAVLALRNYHPQLELPFAEQSALDIVMNNEAYKQSFTRVPWHWFNAYPEGRNSHIGYRDGKEPSLPSRARKGDFVAHFAGFTGRGGEMEAWEDMIDKLGDVWAHQPQRDISRDIAEYWQSYKKGELTHKQITGEDEVKEEEVKEEEKTAEKEKDGGEEAKEKAGAKETEKKEAEEKQVQEKQGEKDPSGEEADDEQLETRVSS